MIGAVLFLVLLIFAFGVLFGNGKSANLFKFVLALIFGPILLAVAYNHIVWLWFGLPLWMKVLSILIIPFLVPAVLRALFPSARGLQVLQSILFQGLVYVATFPFRFLWRAGCFALQRERRSVRLNPLRPAVGGRPPLITATERRQGGREPREL